MISPTELLELFSFATNKSNKSLKVGMILKTTLLSSLWLVSRIPLETESLMPLLVAMKEVLESEWSLETTKSQLSLSPKKLESFLKIGNQLKETVPSWKEKNSDNSLEEFKKKEKVKMKLNTLETLKTSSKLETNFASWPDHLLMINISSPLV